MELCLSLKYAKESLTDNNVPSCACAICLCHFQVGLDTNENGTKNIIINSIFSIPQDVIHSILNLFTPDYDPTSNL